MAPPDVIDTASDFMHVGYRGTDLGVLGFIAAVAAVTFTGATGAVRRITT